MAAALAIALALSSLLAAPAAPVAAATCGTANAALNAPATASSTESASYPASAAVDGDTGSRWSSQFSDPQWLRIDLGSSQQLCEVDLTWEAAYARAFELQTSPDGNTWTDIYSTTTGPGGSQAIPVTGSGRYLRIYGTQRATPYGYSLFEVAVHTPGGGSTIPPTDPKNPQLRAERFRLRPRILAAGHAEQADLDLQPTAH
ncbi:discoidin domain-containing protein [Fodinicola feengrottensis]|uniref:discoidin domain-containing protein n=1 Tax=Fodinicola feengrottensis TaxID=435914 RepID=UPI00244289E0|nr:discoidin domain-containing protein [Fodinicola feengrottensis]